MLLVLLVASGGAVAQPYVDAQLALGKPTGFDVGLEALVSTGIPVAQRKNLFLEAELATTLMAPQEDSSGISHSSLGGYGIYRRMVDERLALHGKVGMLYQYSTPEQDGIQRGLGIAIGVGATIRHDRAISYLIEGVAVQGTLDLFRISAGIRYLFR
ncbi:MAG TPA: hypothetical protein ENJ43_00670 [Gammaproteobacteria bacterium]|nr:hypothetical protein [Gammaproteobacteria bacterium]